MAKKPTLESLLEQIKEPSARSIIKAMQQHITDASLETLARYIVKLEREADHDLR